MKKLLFILLLAACNKSQDFPQGIYCGQYYSKVQAAGTYCAGNRLYTLWDAKNSNSVFTINFTAADTLKTGGTYRIYINKWSNGWVIDSATLVNVVYSGGVLNADWNGGYIKNVLITEK